MLYVLSWLRHAAKRIAQVVCSMQANSPVAQDDVFNDATQHKRRKFVFNVYLELQLCSMLQLLNLL